MRRTPLVNIARNIPKPGSICTIGIVAFALHYYGGQLLIGPNIVGKKSEMYRFCVHRRSYLIWFLVILIAVHSSRAQNAALTFPSPWPHRKFTGLFLHISLRSNLTHILLESWPYHTYRAHLQWEPNVGVTLQGWTEAWWEERWGCGSMVTVCLA